MIVNRECCQPIHKQHTRARHSEMGMGKLNGQKVVKQNATNAMIAMRVCVCVCAMTKH